MSYSVYPSNRYAKNPYTTNYTRVRPASYALQDPLFGSLFERFFTAPTQAKSKTKSDDATASNAQRITPQVDIFEADKDFKLVVNLPGYSKQEVSIDLNDGVLTIKAEHAISETTADDDTESKATASDESAHYKALRREIASGYFERSFTLDESVNTEAVSAAMTNGVLTVILPKAEEPQPVIQRVEIS